VSPPGPRTVWFAGCGVAVDADGAAAHRIAAFLFGGFPSPPAGAAPPLSTYHLGPGAAPGTLALRRDGVVAWEGADDGEAAECWLGAVSRELATHSRGGLLLHAGALALPGGGLALLPGGVGAGKTTLTLHLASRGLGYRSDEMAFVPDGGADATGCPRPLNLKQGALAAVRGIVDGAGAAGALAHPRGLLVDPRGVGAPPGAGPLPVRLLLFPRFAAGAAFSLEPLGRAHAGLALMECLVNARNLPGHGFAAASGLAALVPAWRLRYSGFAQLGPLERLLGLN
jgi:hypothetical protein